MKVFRGKDLGSRAGLSLALGGGGARGLAHVGVLEVLHARGAPIVAIAGTSAGAVAGAGYALGHTPREMRARVMEFSRSELANHRKIKALVEEEEEPFSWRSLGQRLDRYLCQGQMVRALFREASVLDSDYFRRVVEFFLPEGDLSRTKIPFFPVATDLLTGQPVPLDSGSLREAVTASSSVPGIAPPVQMGGRHLVDGGAACLVPVEIAMRQEGAMTVGVGVDRDIVTESPPDTALDAYLRAGDILMARLGELLIAQAQLAIRPQVGHIHWLEFGRAREIMDLGAAAAEEAWPRIQEALHRPSFTERLAERLWSWG